MTRTRLLVAILIGLFLAGVLAAVLTLNLRTATETERPGEQQSRAFLPGMVESEVVRDDDRAVQVFVVAGSADAGRVAGQCVSTYLVDYDAANCYVYESEEALESSGVPAEFGVGLERVCWVAFASGSVEGTPSVTASNPDYDPECP